MAQNTRAAGRELNSASRHQSNARTGAYWLIFMLGIILTVSLLVVMTLSALSLILGAKLKVGFWVEKFGAWW